jgi:hypothetical protein
MAIALWLLLIFSMAARLFIDFLFLPGVVIHQEFRC